MTSSRDYAEDIASRVNDRQKAGEPFMLYLVGRVQMAIDAAVAEAVAERDAAVARALKVEAQMFKAAEWLLTEKNIAQEGVGDPGVMGLAFRQRAAEINALLDGSAGESYLVDVVGERDAALALARELARVLDNASRDPTFIHEASEVLNEARAAGLLK